MPPLCPAKLQREGCFEVSVPYPMPTGVLPPRFLFHLLLGLPQYFLPFHPVPHLFPLLKGLDGKGV